MGRDYRPACAVVGSAHSNVNTSSLGPRSLYDRAGGRLGAVTILFAHSKHIGDSTFRNDSVIREECIGAMSLISPDAIP
jgi:hypothetical protein